MTEDDYRRFWAFVSVVLAIAGYSIAVICVCSSHVLADVFVYGSEYNYSVNVLPNNSYVHQGENISQGCYYDLTGVYGWSGILGMWKHEGDIGYTMPDAYIDFNGGPLPRHYYTDPEKMPAGDWYQLDKFSFKGTSDDTSAPSFGQNNALAFHLVGKQYAISDTGELLSPPVQTTIATYYRNITQYNGTGIEHIPVSYTQVETVTASSTFVPAGDVVVITLQPTKSAAGVNATPTPKEAPLPLAIILMSIVGVILWRRN